MDWQMVAALVGVSTLVSIAAWRFSRVETILKGVVVEQKNQHDCQSIMSKSLVRVNANLKTVKAVLIGILQERKRNEHYHYNLP